MAPPLVRETHVSWVVFVGDRVYKIKKPVAYDFLDWTSSEAREAACRQEVVLNRRLAPDVYLGVGHFTSPGGAVEPVVVMKRLPGDRSLGALLERGDPGLAGCITELAGVLSSFHAGADRGPEVDRDCSFEAVSGLWQSNLAELVRVVPSPATAADLAEVGELAERYLGGRRQLFEDRVQAGAAVDGHGDLLCDDTFCTADGVRILDCLEFDPALRHVDPVCDVASLAMDIEHHGRPDLAAALVEAYRARTSGSWPPSLLHFWIAYRALVRAKVAAYRAGPAAAGERAGFVDEVAGLVALARRHLQAGRVRVVLVGGLPGTGKSTLAGMLSSSTGWPVLSSDAIRRGGAGHRRGGAGPEPPADVPYGQGIYSEASVEANYRALMDEAANRLRRGASVILDASWSVATRRRAAEAMAADRLADVVPLVCVVPPEVARHRIVDRLAGGGGMSDATPEVAEAMAAASDPWPEAVRIDTSGAPDEALAAALGAVDRFSRRRPAAPR